MQADSKSLMEAKMNELVAITRLRKAVQFCKQETGLSHVHNDRAMDAEKRMVMERCLTQNYLLKLGMDYFGKRDLLYIDMRGDQDIDAMYDMNTQLSFKPAGNEEAGDDE